MRRGALGGIGLVAAVVLAGCSGSTTKTRTAATQPTTTTTEAPTTTTAPGPLVKAADTRLGNVLANGGGMTLYTRDSETATNIVCTGACASTWLPLPAPADAAQPTAGPGVPGTLSVVTRPDGVRQIAHDGRPLYTFSGDSQPGDTNGEGVGGVWHVVKTTPASTSSGASSQATSPPRTSPPRTSPPATSPPAMSPPRTSPPATRAPYSGGSGGGGGYGY